MSGRGTVLGGRYRLTERIGGGGMGSVWRAEDEVLERQVAVKLLHQALFEDGTFAMRFRREAQLLAALNHPGIVDVHDYGETGGVFGGGDAGDEDGAERAAYIVMELVDGRPLDAVLAESGPMSPERALGLLARALDALHTAHRQDIVHRDIKPSNLMVRAGDEITVTDFGIARAIASTKITASHTVLGTALYMAPEQAEGKVAAAPAGDLYSIGVVGYELLIGETPFSGESVLEVALKHIREPLPELPDTLPGPVRDFLTTALAKQPEDRFADAAAMAAAARAAIGAAPVAVSDAPPAAAVVPPADAPKAPRAEAPAGEKGGKGKAAEGEEGSKGKATGGEEGGKGRPAARPEADTAAARTRRRLFVPVVIPVIITVSAGTAMIVDLAPFRSEAGRAGGQPPAAVAGTTPGVTASAATDAATPPPTGTPVTPGATPVPTDPAAAVPGQPVNPNPAGGAGAGAVVGGAAGGTGAGAVGGSGSGGGAAAGGQGGSAPRPGATAPANPPAVPAQPPAPSAPPAQTPPPVTETVPQGCGGTNWGYLVNVGDGLRAGLAQSDLSGGNVLVMGGASSYGWVHTVPSSWHQFNACNLGGPVLVQDTGSNKVMLSPGFSFMTNWTVSPAPTSGAFYLKDYMGSTCLTDNGAGNPVTMVTCTPGNKAQQWKVPPA
ncbi:serine/threonine-protein kinase [Kitasatospora sp. NPDC004240]